MTPRAPARRRLLVACAGLALPAWGTAAQVETVARGTRLQPSVALDAQGAPVAIPAQGRASVVNLWATWCPPCRVEMPLLHQLAEFYAGDVVLQAVNHKERAATVQAFLRNTGSSLPLLVDASGATAQAWGVKVFPSTFGFDAQGRARWRVTGEYDWTSAEAGRLVESLFK